MSEFDRASHAKRVGMQKGETRNPGGSKHKIRISKSPLRKTADSLREVEQDALDAIKKSVKGQEVDKTQLDTAKWLIGMIQTLDKSASQDEISAAKLRMDAKKAEDAGAGIDDVHNADVVPMARLKLTYESEDEE